MKKTIIAFAALASFAGLASAQSSVTLSGRVVTSVGKKLGSAADFVTNKDGKDGIASALDNRVMGNDWSGLIFSGVEDLGNGMSAGFKLNPRFNVVDGISGGSQSVGFGEKLVFLQGGFGKVSLGTVSKPSQDATSFVDPNGWSVGDRGSIWTGGPSLVEYENTAAPGATPKYTAVAGGDYTWSTSDARMDRAVRYEYNANGLYAGVALSDKNAVGLTGTEMPVSLGVGFEAMGFKVGVGHERGRLKVKNQENWSFLSLGYSLSGFGVTAGAGAGKDQNGVKRQSALVGLSGQVGTVGLMATYGQIRVGSVGTDKLDDIAKIATVGARYSLSKRTTVFANAAYDKAVKDTKVTDANKLAVGYEVGVRHTF